MNFEKAYAMFRLIVTTQNKLQNKLSSLLYWVVVDTYRYLILKRDKTSSSCGGAKACP